MNRRETDRKYEVEIGEKVRKWERGKESLVERRKIKSVCGVCVWCGVCVCGVCVCVECVCVCTTECEEKRVSECVKANKVIERVSEREFLSQAFSN